MKLYSFFLVTSLVSVFSLDLQAADGLIGCDTPSASARIASPSANEERSQGILSSLAAAPIAADFAAVRERGLAITDLEDPANAPGLLEAFINVSLNSGMEAIPQVQVVLGAGPQVKGVFGTGTRLPHPVSLTNYMKKVLKTQIQKDYMLAALPSDVQCDAIVYKTIFHGITSPSSSYVSSMMPPSQATFPFYGLGTSVGSIEWLNILSGEQPCVTAETPAGRISQAFLMLCKQQFQGGHMCAYASEYSLEYFKALLQKFSAEVKGELAL